MEQQSAVALMTQQLGGANVPALATQETAGSAVAAQAAALVEMRYRVAYSRPRNWDQVRQDMLRECQRPTFANDKSALYAKPAGGSTITGLGIRFAEMALRCMKNVAVETYVVYEDQLKRIVRVSVTDLESNLPYTQDVTVAKTVERRKADDGYLSMRKNSRGETVYTVLATDDDLLNKQQSLVSKAMRTLVLRFVPGDLAEECENVIRKVRADRDAQDPDAEKRKIVDGFARLNVRAEDLVEYLGHPLDIISPAEIDELRTLWGTISESETTWAAVMETRREQRAAKAKAEAKATTKPKGVDALKEKALGADGE